MNTMTPQKEILSIIEEAFSDIHKVLLLSDNDRLIEKFQLLGHHDKIVFAVTKEKLYNEMTKDKKNVIQLPMSFSGYHKTAELAIEIALKMELFNEKDNIVVMSNIYSDRIDTVNLYDLSKFKITGFYGILTLSGSIQTDVLKALLRLATEMGKKGSEGKPIGAIFIVGDSKAVMEKSTAISFNPFESRKVNVTDSIIKSMIKEFSLLDGAFVINEKGTIIAAHRYLKADPKNIQIPQGLGARHISAASMTTETNSIAIVLSESDNLIRIFHQGKLILEMDPAEYR